MTFRTIRTTSLSAAFAGAFLLAGCASAIDETDDQGVGAGDDARPATLMLNWTPNAHHAGIYYAQEHGLYEEVGINLDIIEPGADIGADTAVAEGRVEFGISQAESLLPARAAGMDLEAIATLLPENDSVLMALEGSGLSDDLASLTGLTYGGYGGALETEIMSQLTECAGGDPASVEFIEIGNVDYLAGLEQERFDVTWVFGGWDALRAQSERDDVVLLSLADREDCIPNWYTPIIVGNSAAMAQDPDLVIDFLDATSRGYHAVVEDPEAGAAALLAGAPELNEDLVHSAVDYYAARYTAQGNFGEMEEPVWQRFVEFLVQAEMLEDESALDGAWTNTYLPVG